MNIVRSFVLAMILAAFALTSATPAKAAGRSEFVSHVYNSVVLLYSQSEDGGQHMRCTATAYRALDKNAGYRFASASHCVPGTNAREQQTIKYFITTDSVGSKTFIPAVLIAAGDKSIGDDFSIFEVKTDLKFDVMPLGDSDKVILGEKVIDVASPFGLGKQYFEGYVSMLLLDRPPLDAGDVQWTNVMLVFIGSGPGSSGSAVISEDQKAIIGFLVGGVNANIGAIVVPVSKFKAFENAVNNGTYKKSQKSQKSHEESDESLDKI